MAVPGGLILQEEVALFSCKIKGRTRLRLAERPVNCPSLIVIHSPFRFHNLRPGEIV